MTKENEILKQALEEIASRGIGTQRASFSLVEQNEVDPKSATGWKKVTYLAKDREDCRVLIPLNGGGQ